jgi:glutaredoxin 3
MKNIIWTTKYCPFCDKAKQLMDDRDITYETRLVDEVTWKLDDLLEIAPNVTTYPQVWVGGNHIGGADELQAFYSMQEMSLCL